MSDLQGGIMKKWSKLLFLLSLFVFQAKAQDKKSSWVYFDLGDTLVNTKDMKKLRYMPGAREYIDKLAREGYRVGIISNIPEEWGLDYSQKLQRLKEVIKAGWIDEVPFDWKAFDVVLLPLKNHEMKPAPDLFLQAIQHSDLCPSVYVGENPKEIKAAQATGMAAQLFSEDSPEPYIPVSKLKKYLTENYALNYDEDCL